MAWKTELAEVKPIDTLDATFALFAGPTEDTAGTGAVVREVKGELAEVIVDEAEHEAFQAEAARERKARADEVRAMHAAEAWYYAEEPVG
jgi:hypothetical protein